MLCILFYVLYWCSSRVEYSENQKTVEKKNDIESILKGSVREKLQIIGLRRKIIDGDRYYSYFYLLYKMHFKRRLVGRQVSLLSMLRTISRYKKRHLAVKIVVFSALYCI